MILDGGRRGLGKGKKDNDVWWPELYALLSRAARHQDLLVTRAPRVEFPKTGPPNSSRAPLEQFAKRARRCRRLATTLAKELGFGEFIRQA